MHQLCGNTRSSGTDHMGIMLSPLRRGEFETPVIGVDGIYTARGIHLASVLLDECGCALREQGSEIQTWKKHVAVGAGLVQRVPQHVQQNLGRSLLYRRIK